MRSGPSLLDGDVASPRRARQATTWVPSRPRPSAPPTAAAPLTADHAVTASANATDRSNGDKPAYRGMLSELGAGIRGADGRLAVRPGSVALADAVTAWSAVNGAAAVGGALGRGRDGTQVVA